MHRNGQLFSKFTVFLGLKTWQKGRALKIYAPTEERAELTRPGELIEYDISDVMLVVQPATHHRWLKPKGTKYRRPGCPRAPQATMNLVM
jgi:hypothetical protein